MSFPLNVSLQSFSNSSGSYTCSPWKPNGNFPPLTSAIRLRALVSTENLHASWQSGRRSPLIIEMYTSSFSISVNAASSNESYGSFSMNDETFLRESPPFPTNDSERYGEQSPPLSSLQR